MIANPLPKQGRVRRENHLNAWTAAAELQDIVALTRGPLVKETVDAHQMAPRHVKQSQRDDALVIDVSTELQFDEAHIPGALSITARRAGFGSKLAWLAKSEQPIVHVGRDDETPSKPRRSPPPSGCATSPASSRAAGPPGARTSSMSSASSACPSPSSTNSGPTRHNVRRSSTSARHPRRHRPHRAGRGDVRLRLAIPFGLLIGLAVGTLGGGGSVLAVPVLVYVLDQTVPEATTASLLVVAAGCRRRRTQPRPRRTRLLAPRRLVHRRRRTAVGTSLIIITATSLLGLAAHLLAGRSLEVDVTAALTVACVAGAVAGAARPGKPHPATRTRPWLRTAGRRRRHVPAHLCRLPRRPAGCGLNPAAAGAPFRHSRDRCIAAGTAASRRARRRRRAGPPSPRRGGRGGDARAQRGCARGSQR